jgi:amino acid permease
MNLIMGLSKSSLYKGGQEINTIFVVVNCFTKLARYFLVISDMTAPQLADHIA